LSRDDDYAELRRWFAATGHAHAVALRWVHTVGYARCGDTSRGMREPPAIVGEDIEYLGGDSGRIDGRDMTADEVIAVRKLLVKMDTDAGDALQGTSTLVVVIRR
jgi:hypothetical protein